MAPLCDTMPMPRRPASGAGAQAAEGQRDAVDIIDVTEAIGPGDRHAVIAGDPRDLRLQRLAFGAGFGKAGREDDDAADAACRAAFDRIENAGAGDREHRAIDAFGQVGRSTSGRAAR